MKEGREWEGGKSQSISSESKLTSFGNPCKQLSLYHLAHLGIKDHLQLPLQIQMSLITFYIPSNATLAPHLCSVTSLTDQPYLFINSLVINQAAPWRKQARPRANLSQVFTEFSFVYQLSHRPRTSKETMVTYFLCFLSYCQYKLSNYLPKRFQEAEDAPIRAIN